MIKKLLIANRGEIAIRVTRTAQEMGVRTVAVFSDTDAESMHVKFADEAVYIGGSEPSESYLRMDKVIDAAKSTEADSIHPGYGFLSERAEFAEACSEAGIAFIGPSASAMRALGAKIEAKQLAVEAGVPVTPGFFEPGASDEKLLEAAKSIGMPVMLKASAGGGGRGMRVVRDESRLAEELAIARDEAIKGFGDGAMMVEKLIERPRHIEVQVLADHHGNVACLFERECSIQRRHQKLIEEAPSTVIGQQHWNEMQGAVRSLILRAGYVGAGTVEFMFDEASSQFYFLEVNARLQVEHPVTESITGLDLVRWQLRIADGDSLTELGDILEGNRRMIFGHSIEARIVAEDPAKSFMPSVGKVLAWAEPKRPGVRVDTGYGPGTEISRFYDSLVAKVIVHADTRQEAINKLEFALKDFHVLGVKTNIEYILEVIRHPEFASGNFDTAFLGREFSDWTPTGEIPPEVADLSERSSALVTEERGRLEVGSAAWSLSDNFRVVGGSTRLG